MNVPDSTVRRGALLLAAGLAVLAVSVAPLAAHGDRLGRLFTTPAERAALEAADPLPQVPRAEARPVVTRNPDRTLVYTGFIRTPAGARRWVNGELGEPDPSSAPELRLPQAAAPLKVGQQLDVDSGAVSERWQIDGDG